MESLSPPGRRAAVVMAGLMAISGLFLAVVILLPALANAPSAGLGFGTELISLQAGEPAAFELDPGEHNLYYIYDNAVYGAAYSVAADPPEVTCSVVGESGAVALGEPRRYAAFDFQGVAGTAVAAFDIRQPGEYVITCDYAGAAPQPPPFFMVGRLTPLTVVGAVVSVLARGVLALLAVALLGAPALGLYLSRA
ncbi:MAG: hypothetical protein GYB64_15005 [Chloroflexi bacterium]|nr:hypothetical protein [Chloroflexota bacterium]